MNIKQNKNQLVLRSQEMMETTIGSLNSMNSFYLLKN